MLKEVNIIIPIIVQNSTFIAVVFQMLGQLLVCHLEVVFQCTQTGQSSNNSPWFFDLNPLLFTCSNSNEYFYNGVAQFSSRLMSIYIVNVKVFFH